MKNYPPEMHTAEHILNQVMVRKYNINRSFSNHIEKKKTKCDFKFDHELSEQEIFEIQEDVNNVINSNVDVKEEFMTLEKASEKFSLEKLPDDAGETIRVINIGDFDSCLCRGQHVNNTKDIGKFRLISSSFNEGVLRIRFKLDKSE